MGIWGIIGLTMLLSFIAQQALQSKFAKYSRVPCALSGAQVAQKMLDDFGIRDVKVTCIKGKLTDHYDPRSLTINLSEGVYGSCSIAAAAVAAHETGHAIQHYRNYAPLRMRSALVPVVNFANNAVSWVLLLGCLMVEVFPVVLWVGIGLFAVTTLFSFVTLPVEIDASRRAVAYLKDEAIVDSGTRPMAAKALRLAAYTYVIAALSSLATLFYYIGIARRD